MNYYWIKDKTRQQIITKTQIPNKGNFKIYANYYNMMDTKGIGFHFSFCKNIEVEKLFEKNGFQYIVLEHNKQKELFILPNERIEEYSKKNVSKIDYCTNEEEIFQLIIEEMS